MINYADADKLYEEIRVYLLERKKLTGITAYQISHNTGLSIKTIDRYFSGHTKDVHIKTLMLIAEGMGLRMDITFEKTAIKEDK